LKRVEISMNEGSETRLLPLIRRLSCFLWLVSIGFDEGCTRQKPPTVDIVWKVSLSRPYVYGRYSKPIEVNGVIYALATEDPDQCEQRATIYAVEIGSGRTLWTTDIETDCFSNTTNPLLFATADVLCYRSKDGSLHVLDGRSGLEVAAEPRVRAVLDVVGEEAHILDSTWAYAILNVRTHKREVQGLVKGNEATQLVHSEKTICLYNYNELSVRDLASGGLLWRRPLDGEAHILVSDNRLYVSSDSKLTVFDSLTGTILWERLGVAGPPRILGNRVYLTTSNGHSRLLLILRADFGEEESTVSVPLWDQRDVVIEGGFIFSNSKKPHYADIAGARQRFGPEQAGSFDYSLVASDLATGETLWSTEEVWGEYITRVVASDNVFCVGVAKIDWGSSATLFGYRMR
jgi:outer membrane protein assembly factor BamB